MVIDEVQTGLGRTGSWWGIDLHGVNPDVLTTGKPLGNGHPMAVVVTSKDMASVLSPALVDTFRISPFQEVIGNTILDVILQEKLVDNAKKTGQFITDYVNT